MLTVFIALKPSCLLEVTYVTPTFIRDNLLIMDLDIGHINMSVFNILLFT